MEKSTIKLPLQYDVELLQADLKQLMPDDWILHYNKRDYEGDWHIIALKSVEGNKYQIASPYEVHQPTLYTEHMDKCPYFKQIIENLPCETTTVRLMRLNPGARIKEHTDYNLSVDDNELRIHIPITTNPNMEFYLDGKRVFLNEGECWYLNFNLMHSLYNGGTEPRVHMVIDCYVNDWLRQQLS